MVRSKEPEVVQAEVIETDVAPLSGLDVLISDITTEAERIAEEFMPRDIKDDADFQQSKSERASANNSIKALKARYNEQMKTIKDAVSAADARMKAALKPLDGIEKAYKEKNDAWESQWKARRLQTIREAYEDFAPDIALPQDGADQALVPFVQLVARYGNAKGTAWTLRGTTEAKAIQAMQDAVLDIAQAEKTIDSMVEEEFRAAAKASYFKTLDLQATLNKVAEDRKQRERVAQLERERKEREEAQRAAMEQAQTDAWLEERKEAPIEPGDVRIVAPTSYETEATVIIGEEMPVVPEEAPVVTEPAPAVYEPAPVVHTAPAPVPTEVAHPWVISIPNATKTQAETIAEFMRTNGIVFDHIYSGDMATAFEKWRTNA